jgi:uncharacterized membrane protein
MGETHLAPVPTAVYGVVLLFAGLAYWILQSSIIAHEGDNSKLREAVGKDTKAMASLASYTAAVPIAFIRPWASAAIYAFIALMWLVPDPRIESRLQD